MSASFSSVAEAWEMECPNCGHDDQIDITAMIDVRLTPDGTDADQADDHAHRWDHSSPTRCRQCGFEGEAGQFET